MFRGGQSNSAKKTRKKKSIALEQQDFRLAQRTNSHTPHTLEKRIRQGAGRKEPPSIKTERQNRQHAYLKENVIQLLEQVQELKKKHSLLEKTRHSLSVRVNEIKSSQLPKKIFQDIDKKLRQMTIQSQNHQQAISILSTSPELQELFYSFKQQTNQETDLYANQ